MASPQRSAEPISRQAQKQRLRELVRQRVFPPRLFGSQHSLRCPCDGNARPVTGQPPLWVNSLAAPSLGSYK